MWAAVKPAPSWVSVCEGLCVSVSPHVDSISSTDTMFSLGGRWVFPSVSDVCFSLVCDCRWLECSPSMKSPLGPIKKRQFVGLVMHYESERRRQTKSVILALFFIVRINQKLSWDLSMLTVIFLFGMSGDPGYWTFECIGGNYSITTCEVCWNLITAWWYTLLCNFFIFGFHAGKCFAFFFK